MLQQKEERLTYLKEKQNKISHARVSKLLVMNKSKNPFQKENANQRQKQNNNGTSKNLFKEA